MPDNERVEALGLQMFAVSRVSLGCNTCLDRLVSVHSAVSLAAYQAEREGWTINDACRVSCPKCSEKVAPQTDSMMGGRRRD